ncbi:MAG: DNA-formamidopyrimidine glycosylase [Leptolinea sp.]|nr:DNA-formamidopyrimidine glycosylase [Leptolinea sp.]
MPELPEVETIVRALRSGGRGGLPILNRTVESTEVLWSKTLASPTLDELHIQVRGQIVKDVLRRGKYIIIQLDRGYLLIHLRMSGDLRVTSAIKDTPLPHDRFVLRFADGIRLIFNDARKFGRVWFTRDPEQILGKLGVDPFDPSLTAPFLFSNLQSKKKHIKSLLLDQSFLAGLGNIYTDESLHRAGIHPLRLSNSLTKPEAGRLLQAIRDTLEEGINRNGASIDWVYRGGDFQNCFRVYQLTGKPCPVCGTIIERIIAGQRGTHFCPRCQPKGV